MRIFYLLSISAVFLLFSCGENERTEHLETHEKWHTVTLNFEGAQTSETAPDNPFLNYRLIVDFAQGNRHHTIRGFYAGDGDAAITGADSGNIWRVRFRPDAEGEWTYSARLRHSDSIALSTDMHAGDSVGITNASGKFRVVDSVKPSGLDFREMGPLEVSQSYFRFVDSGNFWLKGGTNSPENLLAFFDFDDTYRMQSMDRDGEAKINDTIHSYLPHEIDWQSGDPSWGEGRGKGLIGGINYLASKGMRSMYFLTNNIGGDGKDVWPYRSPDDLTRFDVSKLAQWDIVFAHMQANGLLMHVVLQETENETMLDGGDTGPLRKLYLYEMIARFGHHPALVWDIGEENGPAPFSPIAQTDAQRKGMIRFIKETDPYRHPVILETHSHDPPRADILDSVKGFQPLDGIALQHSKRETVAETVMYWKDRSSKAGHEWLVSMDEIGMWHTGALNDAEDPGHKSLRGDVLWGSLLSGAAGVEWYFGTRSAQNDLNNGDWRTRDYLWDLTRRAISFFEEYLPYWEMRPHHELVGANGAYCMDKPGEVYALYFPKPQNYTLDLSGAQGSFSVRWFDPLADGNLLNGSVTTVEGGVTADLGVPPKEAGEKDQDWVLLVRRAE